MASKVKPRTVADFKALHDKDVIVPNKIRAGLQALLDIGPQHWEYDDGFRALCGLQAAELANYRDLFKRNWFLTPGKTGGKTPKRVWFGNAKVADAHRPTPVNKD